MLRNHFSIRLLPSANQSDYSVLSVRLVLRLKKQNVSRTVWIKTFLITLLDTKNEKRRIFLLEVTSPAVSSSFSAKLCALRKVSRTDCDREPLLNTPPCETLAKQPNMFYIYTNIGGF